MGSADTAAVAPDLAGSVVAGRYRILSLVSEGAMGLVYAAWHIGLDQRVAFKILRRGRDGAFDPVARQRFQREARAAARVQNDHICRVLDTGVLDDDTPFLVMEYLEGRDLAAELGARGALPVPEAAHYIRQACAALAEAHRAGIVHRDLKPANLFLQDTLDALHPEAQGRRVKLLDFGISKSPRSEEANVSLTRTSTLLGSPIYMSPEQLNSSRDVDARSDVWALGVILYELVTGAPPFEAESMAQLVNAVLHQSPTPCTRHGVALAGLDAIFQRVLHKDRERRFQSVVELAAALAPFEGEQAATPRTVAAVLGSRAEPRASTFSSRADPRASPIPLAPHAPGTYGAAATVSLHDGKVARSSLPPSRPPRRVPSTLRVALVGLVLGFAAAGTHGLLTRRASRARPPPLVSSSVLGAAMAETPPSPAASGPDPGSASLEAVWPVPARAARPWDLAALPVGELPPAAPWPHTKAARTRRHAPAPDVTPGVRDVEARGSAREQKPDTPRAYPFTDFGGRR